MTAYIVDCSASPLEGSAFLTGDRPPALTVLLPPQLEVWGCGTQENQPRSRHTASEPSLVSAESRLTSAAGLTRLCCRASPAGLCALSINNDNCYLAYPGSATIGEVQVFDTINLVSASPGRPSLPLLRHEPRGASGLRGSWARPLDFRRRPLRPSRSGGCGAPVLSARLAASVLAAVEKTGEIALPFG